MGCSISLTIDGNPTCRGIMAAGGVSRFEGEFIHSQWYEIHSVSCACVLISVAEVIHGKCQL